MAMIMKKWYPEKRCPKIFDFLGLRLRSMILPKIPTMNRGFICQLVDMLKLLGFEKDLQDEVQYGINL